jgi:hypothetical protein
MLRGPSYASIRSGALRAASTPPGDGCVPASPSDVRGSSTLKNTLSSAARDFFRQMLPVADAAGQAAVTTEGGERQVVDLLQMDK